MCGFHDPKLHHGCREERAEHVQHKDHANFCEFFQPRSDAHAPKDLAPTEKARTQLDALFGAAKPEPGVDPARAELDKLFANKPKG
jgi:hypothetical protein